MDHRVKQIIALMKEYLHRGWPATRMARFVNISTSRLHQLFKEEIGLPPARYLHLLRMEQAKEHLEISYLSVKEVMARVGLTDESHFVRDFKKSYGCTPSRYRERFRDGDYTEDSPEVDHRLSSVPEPALSPAIAKRAAYAPLASAAAAPPLLLRRPSHPRQLAEDHAALPRTQKKRELLSLLHQRHRAFAELTTAITDNMAQSRSTARSIFYRERKTAVPPRRPPVANRRRALHPAPSSTVPPHLPPSTAKRKA
jgi:AraC-like DNA-binding protein